MSHFTLYEVNKIDATSELYCIISAATDAALSLSSLIDRTPLTALTCTAGAGAVTFYASLSTGYVVNAIMLQNINFKNYSVMVNSTTVSLSASTGGTTTASWTNWSDGNAYLEFASITASSIQININSTTSGGNRQIGQLIATNEMFTFIRNPNFSDYKPNLDNLKLEKKAADGGSIIYKVCEKYTADLTLKFVDASTSSDLYRLYNTSTSYIFLPYPTVSAWGGEAYKVNWTNDFTFKQPSYNNRQIPYYNGKITFKETPL
jgi:hypothetical protein